MSEAGPVGLFNRERLMSRVLPVFERRWQGADAVAWARDFGAGLAGDLAQADARFLDAAQPWALPMIAVPLCDGDFWQQASDTGIDWRQIIHAEEVLTLVRPLPAEGTVQIHRQVVDVRDRGASKGALMSERDSLCDAAGLSYAHIDVSTVLRGNGGFGGPPPDAVQIVQLPERPADLTVDVRTPSAQGTRLCISAELDVAAGIPGCRSDQQMIRGVGCFGLAGRGALALLCGNDPARLRRFGVRYGGPMLTDETMRLELWHTGPGLALLRMQSVERQAKVLSSGFVEFEA
jgi:hypothetical protein